jgi:hypothetical protein
MEKFRREFIGKDCSVLYVYECPVSLIRAAVEISEGDATIENFHPNRTLEWHSIRMQLFPQEDVVPQVVRSVCLDVSLSREEFLGHLDFWNGNGVYAVFARSGPIKFRASDMQGIARYRALKNFHWSIELAIPGPSSGPWGHIASPDRAVIDSLFIKAQALYSV